MLSEPEHYFVGDTPYVPGSELPVVVYRGALKHCQNEEEIRIYLESNGGWVRGGAWNAWFKSHYHPNVHECYGVATGSSELSIGRGPLDDHSAEQLIRLNKGDVMIIPAGVSHCSSTATEDYRFIVFFPKEDPKWISVWCQTDEDTAENKQRALQVPLPSTDPLEGPNGYLIREWSKIATANVN
ncbi:hypothetical protein GQ53DRAFT_830900 [Thozetella sp. PMI_491]|nr:hypothetical protein GQ53DRAFT_830900 [Thozetella sp. PMI_491]